MRFRLIGVLAALLMLAPVAGFARTSTPVRRDAASQTSSKKKKIRKKKSHKKSSKKKSSKKSSKKKQSVPMPMGG
ncbi:MAG TPA: hypothetical protein VNJ52_05345 [Patescibacteria group bacterium]|nr:hypothetical protein [Patescibacteria group bacterium]